MSINLFTIIATAFICFIIPAIAFSRSGKQKFNQEHTWKNSVFIPFAVSVFIGGIIGYFCFYENTDFVNSFNLAELIIPIIAATMIYLCGYHPKLSQHISLVILAAAIISAFAIPSQNLVYLPDFTSWLNRIIIIAVWFLFSYTYRYTNSGDGMLPMQSLTITSGITILSLLGAIPMFLGFYGMVISAAILAIFVFNWYPSRIKISSSASRAIGFIIFSLISYVGSENAIACAIIFSMFMIVDIIWALALKLTFQNKYHNLIDNTGYQQALIEGMKPIQAVAFSFRMQILLVFFGCFQIYSPISGSLIIISALITIWFSYRYRNMPVSQQSIKDINTQFLEEMQDRVNDFKEYIKKDEED